MELRPLRALVEVVRQGGFSQAAKTIHATQPTVSKAIKQLEDELGMPLLDRQVYPPRLTEAGEIVYRRALSMLAERDDLRAELDAARPAARRAAPGPAPAGSSSLFAPLFARFRSRYPRIEISLVEHGSRRLEELVMAGEIELAATLRPVPDNFDWQPVAREPLIALMPAEHPRAGADAVGLVELRDTPFILFETGFALNRNIQDACQRAGFTPTVARAAGRPTSSSPWSPPAWAWPSCRASRPTRKPTPASAAYRCAIPAPIGKWCRSGGAAAIFHTRRKPGWR